MKLKILFALVLPLSLSTSEAALNGAESGRG